MVELRRRYVLCVPDKLRLSWLKLGRSGISIAQCAPDGTTYVL